ncbi:hypothetical protein [Sphingobium bisphenolivorans]|uniref:hypothetical protein n=1 Tax=Sphingobium bisphenolivorans TaxID=1335760 RepID=UPI0003B4C94F|nr:hypothetical protein [Sphingobium bisphenolivorans]
MRRALSLALPLLIFGTLCGTSAHARDSLGIFEAWGAFRDPATPRCYAIAMPVARDRQGFAAIGSWPRRQVRGQVHFRLSRMRSEEAPVILSIGDRRFPLVAGQVDAWAPDARADAAIVAALRSATSMSVQTRDARGRGFADTYALRGAATAIDAAALGCARTR